jgi:hypothetical protein
MSLSQPPSDSIFAFSSSVSTRCIASLSHSAGMSTSSPANACSRPLKCFANARSKRSKCFSSLTSAFRSPCAWSSALYSGDARLERFEQRQVLGQRHGDAGFTNRVEEARQHRSSLPTPPHMGARRGDAIDAFDTVRNRDALGLHALLRDAVNPSLGAPQKRMETEHAASTSAWHAALHDAAGGDDGNLRRAGLKRRAVRRVASQTSTT